MVYGLTVSAKRRRIPRDKVARELPTAGPVCRVWVLAVYLTLSSAPQRGPHDTGTVQFVPTRIALCRDEKRGPYGHGEAGFVGINTEGAGSYRQLLARRIRYTVSISIRVVKKGSATAGTGQPSDDN